MSNNYSRLSKIKNREQFGWGILFNSTIFKLCVLLLCFLVTNHAYAVTYYSKASATAFSNTASWGTATDGTGAAPASISTADDFYISNSSAMTLDADASVRSLIIATGSLTVSANTPTPYKD